MATTTTNYGLKKPEYSDTVDIGDINGNMDILDSELDKLSGALALIQRGDEATQNIEKGQYVLWKGTLTIASVAITVGETLSASNLTTLNGGGMNAIAQPQVITAASGYSITRNGSIRIGNTIFLDFQVEKNSGTFSTDYDTVATISDYSNPVNVMAINCVRGSTYARVEVYPDGIIRAQAATSSGNAMYINMVIGIS